MQGPVEQFFCTEALLETSEQLCAAVHLHVVGLDQDYEH